MVSSSVPSGERIGGLCWSDCDDFVPNGVEDKVRQTGQLELQHDSSPVPFHGAHTNVETFSDLPVAVTFG